MSLFRTALIAAAIALSSAALAQTRTSTLGRALGMGSQSTYDQARETLSPMANLGLRGGVMASPRGAAVVGLDFTVPQLSFKENWEGRFDADVIIKANLAGVNTLVPITFDQILTSPSGGFGGKSSYVGFGAGALLGGKSRLDGKVILGAEVTSKLAIEVNYHFAEKSKNLLVFVARGHM